MNSTLFKFAFALILICNSVNFAQVEARRQSGQKPKPKTQTRGTKNIF